MDNKVIDTIVGPLELTIVSVPNYSLRVIVKQRTYEQTIYYDGGVPLHAKLDRISTMLVKQVVFDATDKIVSEIRDTIRTLYNETNSSGYEEYVVTCKVIEKLDDLISKIRS